MDLCLVAGFAYSMCKVLLLMCKMLSSYAFAREIHVAAGLRSLDVLHLSTYTLQLYLVFGLSWMFRA